MNVSVNTAKHNRFNSFWLVTASVFIYPFLPIIKEWSSSVGSIVEIALIAGLFSLVLAFALAQRLGGSLIPASALLIIFLLLHLLRADNYIEAFSGFRSLIVPVLIYLAYFGSPVSHEVKRETSLFCFLAVALVMAIGCVVQFIEPSIISQLHSPESQIELRSKTDWVAFSVYNRALSLMSDPNILSVFFSVALLNVTSHFGNKTLGRNKMLIVAAIIILGILLTQSRTGIILSTVVMTYRIAEAGYRGKMGKWTIIILSISMIALVVVTTFSFDEILQYLRIDTFFSGNNRFDNNALHLSALTNDSLLFLFGSGLFDGRLVTFENSYLLLVYMFGLLGTMIYLTLMGTILKPLLNKENFISLIVFAIAMFVGDYILIPQISIYFVVSLLLNSEL